MTKASATGRRHREAEGGGLFPSMWPWRAWYSFEQDLLTTVYAKSGDLWQVLRDRCRDVTSMLQHLEYEGEIERDDWIVLSALPSDVLAEARVDLWGRVLRRQPLPLSLLATHPVDISRN